jgi:hypothetical protein
MRLSSVNFARHMRFRKGLFAHIEADKVKDVQLEYDEDFRCVKVTFKDVPTAYVPMEAVDNFVPAQARVEESTRKPASR